jgi:hypothetical protein
MTPEATPSTDTGSTVPAIPSTVATAATAPSTSGSPIPPAVPAAPAPVPTARLQEIDLGADVLTSTVSITILSTTAHGGRDQSAIPELAVR